MVGWTTLHQCFGAAIGHDFSCELLAMVAQRTEPELDEAMNRLVDSGLVFAAGAKPHATFLFKHALVQDTAYSMLAYWLWAGQQSAMKSGFIEAIAHLRKGMRLTAELPDSHERKQRELELQVNLAAALMEAEGRHPLP